MALATVPTRTPVKRPLVDLPGMTNLGGFPVAPPTMQSPTLPPSPQAPGFTFAPPTIGPAPTPTPLGTFQAPGPNLSAAGRFRIDQANRGAERSAAARGTLFSGGFQAALARLNQGLASEEYDRDFNRSLAAYGTNRDTHALNFGQNLASFNAGTGATLDAARLGLAGETAEYDRTYGAQRDAYGDAVDAATQQTNVLNTNAQAAAIQQQQMADFIAALEAQKQAATARQNAETDRIRGTMPTRLGGLPGAARRAMRG